jgi:hypothetical protein
VALKSCLGGSGTDRPASSIMSNAASRICNFEVAFFILYTLLSYSYSSICFVSIYLLDHKGGV